MLSMRREVCGRKTSWSEVAFDNRFSKNWGIASNIWETRTRVLKINCSNFKESVLLLWNSALLAVLKVRSMTSSIKSGGIRPHARSESWHRRVKQDRAGLEFDSSERINRHRMSVQLWKEVGAVTNSRTLLDTRMLWRIFRQLGKGLPMVESSWAERNAKPKCGFSATATWTESTCNAAKEEAGNWVICSTIESVDFLSSINVFSSDIITPQFFYQEQPVQERV